jgi:hypothetical protein
MLFSWQVCAQVTVALSSPHQGLARGCRISDARLDAGTNDHGCEMTVLPLVGRERELQVLNAVVDGVGDRGGALVVCGEPGIGKSALLAMASRRATDRGMLALTAAGVQSETHLPFAGLHQLLRPILAGAEG